MSRPKAAESTAARTIPPSTFSPSAAPATSSAPRSPSETLRKRKPTGQQQQEKRKEEEDSTMVSLDEAPGASSWTSRNRWIVLAIASGACAAFNGVFAKLTTNNLTSHLSQALARTFGLESIEGAIELIFRGIFFGLNLVFNGVMWTLFTKALASGNSTTQVSIMNTSTNFMITALLGFMIFSESLPPLWWAGAALLVAGNVIIGRKDEGEEDGATTTTAGADSSPLRAEDAAAEDIATAPAGSSGYGAAVLASAAAAGIIPGPEKEDEDEDIPLLGNLDEDSDRQ